MRTETLKVAGMTCGGCVASVTKALKAVDGVSTVAVSLNPGEAKIEFDDGTTSFAHLRAAVERAGYKLDSTAHQVQAKGGCCG
jgi:copper chaperone